MKKLIMAVLLLICAGLIASAQLTREDYQRADSATRFNELVYHAFVRPTWIDESNTFWYQVDTRAGDIYYLVNAEKAEKKEAFDTENLTVQLKKKTGIDYRPDSLPVRNLRFNKDLTEVNFMLNNAKWKYVIETKILEKTEDIEPPDRERRYWGESRDELANDPVLSPDSLWEGFIRDYNVFVRDRKTEKIHQLSYDGAAGDYYSSYMQWSPDSKKIATFRIREAEKHLIWFVESSPDEQLQPKLHQREYHKPGDAIPISTPGLFDVVEKKQIPVDGKPFVNQFSLNNLKWWEDGRAFTFEFNQRGHQVYQVVEVNATTGQTRVLIDERSSTFIDYSSKKMRHDVNDGEEIIWASERDGWNHLYLYDGATGQVKNQITAGEWVVRRIIHVDEDNRQIIFSGNGRNRGEDPYLIHYYRIGLDGNNLIKLTTGNAFHQATFSEDKTYFVDHYSRVDMPPETVLRESSTGRVIMSLEKADITDLLATGWNMPEVFTARGRDGKTDIWGIIYRPTTFDHGKTYPVIENIYAGPHGSYVPKTFRPYLRGFSGLAELGFVVVQMDGMGTSNRSKAFHDVCWHNIKDAGFPDRIRWIKAAAGKYPCLDISNVGIFGTSAGGQNAMAALLFHPEFYKVGVASCGCHDNRMDKIWWNEQWMGYPVGPHYAENSNVDNAHLLEGRLMLLVGEVDDNVDPASTLQVADALIKADKEFELVVLPGMNHTSGGKYGERKRRDFFVKHILGHDPPDWNRE
jgi:dipeptidyl aminopeptidase/acylaminoacyl peptidase